jgi:hypothetical protein
MKKLLIILILLIPLVSVNAQETKSRKEKRAEKEMQKKEEIKKLIDDRSFIFYSCPAFPMGGSSINLNYYFNVKIDGDSIQSYLPFYGVAYTAEYGSRNSPLDFGTSIEDYSVEKDKNGYQIQFDVKNGNDYLNYTFRISELGFASLNVTSTNRQSISFTGKIEPVENDDI